MFRNLTQTNQAQLLFEVDEWSTIYIKQYGAGTLRINPNPDDLNNSVPGSAPFQDGIVQVTSDGWKQYFWKGSFYVITDIAGYVAWVVTGGQPYLNRGFRGIPAQLPQPTKGKLSTY